MGRPAVDSEEVSVRIKRPMLDSLDSWRDQQDDKPGRPEAIRRILKKELG
jgi:metal-responsive CopG/Arc/MetJ family transcriptional regulator